MKHLLFLCCVTAAMASDSANSLAEDPNAKPIEKLKIGVVDMKRLFEACGSKEMEATIREKRDQGGKEIEERNEAVKKARAEMEELGREIANPALGSAGKEEKTSIRRKIAAAVEMQEREIEELQTAQEQGLKNLSERLRAGVLERINKAVEAEVKDGKYDIVLDRSLSNAPQVNSNGPNATAIDMTEAVLSTLNKEAGPNALPVPAASQKPAAPEEKR